MGLIQKELMVWGEAMQVTFANRSLSYSPVLKNWRVKKWPGKGARKFIYQGEDLEEAITHLLGEHQIL
jgi:hypothetical protein